MIGSQVLAPAPHAADTDATSDYDYVHYYADGRPRSSSSGPQNVGFFGDGLFTGRWTWSEYRDTLFHPAKLDSDLWAANVGAYSMIAVGTGGLAGIGAGGAVGAGVAYCGGSAATAGVVGGVVGSTVGGAVGTVVGTPGGPVAQTIGGIGGGFAGGWGGANLGYKLGLKINEKAAEAAARAALASGANLTAQQQRAIQSLEQRIAEHQQKLADYIKNPEAFDNLGFLKNAPTPEIRQNIIDGRILHLEGEIRAFQGAINKILGGGQ